MLIQGFTQHKLYNNNANNFSSLSIQIWKNEKQNTKIKECKESKVSLKQLTKTLNQRKAVMITNIMIKKLQVNEVECY